MIEKFIREEADGSKTTTYATDINGVWKMHNIKGPALVNKKQEIEDYYLFGIKCTKDEWKKKLKFK